MSSDEQEISRLGTLVLTTRRVYQQRADSSTPAQDGIMLRDISSCKVAPTGVLAALLLLGVILATIGVVTAALGMEQDKGPALLMVLGAGLLIGFHYYTVRDVVTVTAAGGQLSFTTNHGEKRSAARDFVAAIESARARG